MVLFFARDAGAANVLAAIYPAYTGEKVFWAKDYARPVLDRLGLAYRDFNALKVDRPLGPEDGPLVSAWLEGLSPTVAVTGATHWDDMTDRLIWKDCAGRGIPAICFLDGWIRPLERFRTKDGLFYPDCIAAVDPAQARLLEQEGLGPGAGGGPGASPICPGIFAQRKDLQARREELRNKVAELLGRPFEELIILVSEPQSVLARAGAQFSDQEFNEVETFYLVKGALDRDRQPGASCWW